MNLDKLLETESEFLQEYPLGFNSETLKPIAKKHKFPQMVDFAHKTFTIANLVNNEKTIDDIVKFVTRSSMVSVFEKVRFKDAIKSMNQTEKGNLIVAIKELFYGDEEAGFNIMVEVLRTYKVAKWPIITSFRCYFFPTTDLLIKPTTVKGVINKFELEGCIYNSKPTFEFYQSYRKEIQSMAKQCDASLSPSLAAFSGFLMFTM